MDTEQPGLLAQLHRERIARLAAAPPVHVLALGDGSGAPRVELATLPGAAIGSVVWEGAAVLAEFLAAAPHRVRGAAVAVQRGAAVLELGAGVGGAGLAAGCLGAASVLLTDTSELVPLLRANIARNGAALSATGCAAAAASLLWGAEGWEAFTAELRAAAGAAGVPGAAVCAACGRPRVSLVLGADVVYREDSALALVDTLSSALPGRGGCPACGPAPPGAAFLMAYKERGAGPVFFEAMAAAGFAARQLLARGEHAVWEFVRPP